MFVIPLDDPEDPPPMLWPSKKEERISWIKRDYDRQMKQMEWLHDDKVPFLDMITGTEIFAEAFGSPIHRADGQTPFALPVVNNLEEAKSVRKPELMDSSLILNFEMADLLNEMRA